ncbi:Glutathione S-transferase T3 [Bienertia sinuspersici]
MQNDEDDVILETQQPIISPHLYVNRNRQQPQVTIFAARSWSTREDKDLVACYMEHYTDAIVGINQKASTLWRKIEELYNAAEASIPNELPVRNVRMLEAHSKRNVPEINLWASCYDEACKKILYDYPKWRVKIRWGMSKKERKVVDLGGVEEKGGGSDKQNRVDDDGDTIIGSSNYTSGGMQ